LSFFAIRHLLGFNDKSSSSEQFIVMEDFILSTFRLGSKKA
jgi:hypothetical protein